MIEIGTTGHVIGPDWQTTGTVVAVGHHSFAVDFVVPNSVEWPGVGQWFSLDCKRITDGVYKFHGLPEDIAAWFVPAIAAEVIRTFMECAP